MPVRMALLGYGRSGSTLHADAIAGSREFRMAAVCDTDPERRRQAAERFGCPVYRNYHDMLARERLDLVGIITRSDQHCAMACDCLKAGVNVLVTKPWAVDAAEGKRMIEAARRSRKRLLPWLPARWGCDLRRLRELLAAGTIGRLAIVRRVVSSFGTRCDWQTRRRYGGGYLLNWGPHIIDPAVLLAGSPVASVYGRLRRLINPGDAEDLFMAVLTLASGTIVQAEYTVSVEGFPDWFLQGDRGTIVVRGNQVKISRHTPASPSDPTQFATMKGQDGKASEETLTGSPYGDAGEVYRDIAQAVRNGKPFPVRPEDALELSRVFDAIRLSDRDNRVVTLRPGRGHRKR